MAEAIEAKDRVGLGWRPELAAGIHQYRDQIDVLEVIADDWFDRRAAEVKALESLARQIPVVLHAVGLGLASAFPVNEQRLLAMAKLVRKVRPWAWSEHLAFVRAPRLEIGHLAAPPRSQASVTGTLNNLARAKRAVGSLPWLENVATLIDPPASPLSEAEWINAILEGSGAGLLIDLHNIYANAINFGRDPYDDLNAMPLAHVRCVHISGGSWVEASKAGKRWLDDHRHDPPSMLLEMLEHLAATVKQPLTVFLERDGKYPGMGVLLSQLDDMRQALARGRARHVHTTLPDVSVVHATPSPTASEQQIQDARNLEAWLAGLYAGMTDRKPVLKDPERAALAAGCSPEDAQRLRTMDQAGLIHALRSFSHKRAGRKFPINH